MAIPKSRKQGSLGFPGCLLWPVQAASIQTHVIVLLLYNLVASVTCEIHCHGIAVAAPGIKSHHGRVICWNHAPLSFVFQMNRPIQVKPADSEGRGGKTCQAVRPFRAARAEVRPSKPEAHIERQPGEVYREASAVPGAFMITVQPPLPSGVQKQYFRDLFFFFGWAPYTA